MKYYTLIGEGHGEITEKKSRFLGAAYPVKSLEEAQERIQAVRQEHYKARHTAYAMVIGSDGMLTRSSDDGEPPGTAGAPMLQTLLGAQLKDSLVIVTRYFGGTLLGTGGLIRAYSQAAKLAVEDAGIGIMAMRSIFEARIGYPTLDKVLYYVRQKGLPEPAADYGSDVVLTFRVGTEEEAAVKEALTQLCQGNVAIRDLGQQYEAVPADPE